MPRKPKGIKRLKNAVPVSRLESKLSMKAFGGLLNSPRYGFEIRKGQKYYSTVFYSKFAAHKFLMILVEDDEHRWLREDEIRVQNYPESHPELITESGLWIKGNGLKEIYDYEFKSNKVRRWRLPDFYYQTAIWFRSDVPYNPPPPQQKRDRISRKGMILIKDICKQLDMHPRDARGILRALDIKKPRHGWAWRTKEEAEKIKQILKDSRRKLQSK